MKAAIQQLVLLIVVLADAERIEIKQLLAVIV
jgi:hypothetical protein